MVYAGLMAAASGMTSIRPKEGRRGRPVDQLRGVRPLPYARAERVRNKIGLTQAEFAALLGIDQRTYSRRATANELKGSESLQVEMIDEVLTEAERVLRSAELAKKWLGSSLIGLENLRPLDHLNSIEGYERVKDALGKIEYGLY